MKTLSRRYKIVRVLLELLLVTTLVAWLVDLTGEHGQPEQQNKEGWKQRDGFLALSYGGLSRKAGGPNMPRHVFLDHLKTLKDAGFKSITTSDVAAFFSDDAPLPDKAVYIMFEGGRRDSTIYGQDVLEETGMRATMCLNTAQISQWNRTFLTRSQIRSLGKSPFWDLCSSGHDVFLPGSLTAGKQSYYLSDFKRSAAGEPEEDVVTFRHRAENDYATTVTELKNLTGVKPQVYVFMPANSMDGSPLPEVMDVNRRFIEDNFAIAFTREGPAFNHRGDNPLTLSRMRIPADYTSKDLLFAISRWFPQRSSYRYETSGERYWQVERGNVAFLPDFMRLTSGDNGNAVAWLTGSEGWRNLRFSSRIQLHGEVAAGVYLRYGSRDSFIRVEFVTDEMRIQERLPDKGLVTIMVQPLDSGSEITFAVSLINNRLTVFLNDQSVTEQPLPVSIDHAGRILLSAETAEGDESFVQLSEIATESIGDSWRVVDDSSTLDHVGTAVMVDVSLGITKGTAGLLLQQASRGVERYAIFPAGDIPNIPSLATDLLPELLQDRIWTGVVYRSGRDNNWTALREEFKTIRGTGLKTAVLVTVEEAEELARLQEPVTADYLLVNAEKLPPEIDGELRRHYGEVLSLFSDGYVREKVQQ